MQPRRAEPPRVFLLSPAHCGGKRAALLLRDEADFPLAVRLRSTEGVSLGEAFSFLSGGTAGVQVITANRGLVAADRRVGLGDLREFGSVDIQADDPRYREPLVGDIARLAQDPALELVLLGSVATGKHLDRLPRPRRHESGGVAPARPDKAPEQCTWIRFNAAGHPRRSAVREGDGDHDMRWYEGLA